MRWVERPYPARKRRDHGRDALHPACSSSGRSIFWLRLTVDHFGDVPPLCRLVGWVLWHLFALPPVFRII